MKTFDGTPIATIHNTYTGIPFTMRLVRQGDGYGRNLNTIHTKPDPLVEFYDARHACDRTKERGGEYGQFVSRYYLHTLQISPSPNGLILDGGVAAWVIDRAAFELALAILTNWTERA